ncbi:hypothetical protein JCM24511_03711 [Saitozyma sp. JCM 24511]|nr:hypothetical protein JCM24511_03711 [Saitozyma sp. JCM 24511]
MDMDEAMDPTTPPRSSVSCPLSPVGPGPSRSGRAESPDPTLVQAYSDLMASLLPSAMTLPPADMTVGSGTIDTDQTAPISRSHHDDVDLDGYNDHDDHGSGLAESGRALTKAEKQNAKKKRRKERERAARLEEETSLAKERAEELARSAREDERKRMVTTFRLFSSCPIKEVSLLPPVEDYPVPPNPRHLPQAQDVAHRIRRIAHESAVDPSSFTTASLASTSTLSVARVPPATAGPSRVLRAERSVPPCFVADVPRLHPAEYPSTSQPTQPSRPPHLGGGLIKHIPLDPVSATDPNMQNQSQNQQRRRRRRRRLREHSYERPPPRFFAPPAGLGGKSRGYAWGWRDSFEGRREDGWEGYLRS